MARRTSDPTTAEAVPEARSPQPDVALESGVVGEGTEEGRSSRRPRVQPVQLDRQECSDIALGVANRAHPTGQRAQGRLASCSGRLVALVGDPMGLHEGEPTGDDGDGERRRGGNEQRSQPPVLASLLAYPLFGRFGFGSFPFGTGVEEGPFGGVQVRLGPRLPVQGSGKAETAVELAVGPLHGVPGVGGEGEVAQDALAFDVVVQPVAEAGPGPGEGLVSQLDGGVVAGDEAGADQQLDELFVFGVGGDGAARDPAAHRFALRRGGDQAQEKVAEQRPLLVGHLAVDLFG